MQSKSSNRESRGSRRDGRSGPKGTILIVDDEVFVRNAFKLYFDTIGFKVLVADGAKTARALFADKANRIDVILLDLVMPGTNGLDLLAEFKRERPDIEVIIATGCGSLSSAIEAMRKGAFDYVTKPIVNFEEELLTVVEDALLRRRRRLRSKEGSGLRGFQGNSEFTYHNLALFERFVKLAGIAALWRAESARETLQEVEQFLERELGIAAGLVCTRTPAGDFAPAHCWGPLRPAPFRAEWFSRDTILEAVQKGELLVFPTEEFDSELLGMEPERLDDIPMAIHVPLLLEGLHRGTLFLFFTKRAEELKNADILDNGHPYLVLAPLFASLFLGAIDVLERDLERADLAAPAKLVLAAGDAGEGDGDASEEEGAGATTLEIPRGAGRDTAAGKGGRRRTDLR